MKKMTLNYATLAMGLAAMGGEGLFPGGGNGIGRILKEPVGKKCNLTGCDKITYHRGGYCCAEHSKEADRLDREKRSATNRTTIGSVSPEGIKNSGSGNTHA